jgi:hypothetical protein
VGLSHDRVKPKTIELVFAASLLSMQHKEIIQEKRWHLDGSMNRCFGYCLFVASKRREDNSMTERINKYRQNTTQKSKD